MIKSILSLLPQFLPYSLSSFSWRGELTVSISQPTAERFCRGRGSELKLPSTGQGHLHGRHWSLSGACLQKQSHQAAHNETAGPGCLFWWVVISTTGQCPDHLWSMAQFLHLSLGPGHKALRHEMWTHMPDSAWERGRRKT